LQLERRRLRVFRYATRRDARFVWPDTLAPILDRGALRCDETRWSPSATTPSSPFASCDRDAGAPAAAATVADVDAPGLHVLDLRHCYHIGPELQGLLTREVASATKSSSSSSDTSAAVECGARRTLRDLGIGVSVVATWRATCDSAEIQLRHLATITVLRLEAAPIYADRQWADFVAAPAVRYVTVRAEPPDQWVAAWRKRGVRVSIVSHAL
jgi:hypothetical protein